MTPESGAGVVEERWHLQDERDFLVRSLADAEREHDAGDMTDEDYELLRRRDRDRLAAVDAALRDLDVAAAVVGERIAGERNAGERSATETEPGTPGVDERPEADADRPGTPGSVDRQEPPPRRRRRRWLAVGGLAAVLVAGAVLLVAHMTAPSLPGQDPSGSVSLSPTAKLAQQLDEAAKEENGGHLVDALQDYDDILHQHPKQAQALAEAGWIEYELGETNKSASSGAALMEDGQAFVEHSIALDPRAYAGHLYLGTIELQADDDDKEAVVQYSEFLALDPPKSIVDHAATFIRTAYRAAGEPVPSGL